MTHAGLGIALLVAGGLAAPTAMGGAAVYLIPGLGVKEGPQIGRPYVAPTTGGAKDKGLEIKRSANGLVVFIRCHTDECITDRGIQVKMSETEVLRRYGAPRAEAQTAAGYFLEYAGIGFEVGSGQVTAISVFPTARR